MKNNELFNLITNMIEYYREYGINSSEGVNELLNLADFSSYEVSRLVNNFHYMNMNIADHAGIPVLKQILQQIEIEEMQAATN
jgi:hypothetical protein